MAAADAMGELNVGGTYEVVLGPPAERVVKALDDHSRKKLADVLCTELAEGPNCDKELRFDTNAQLWDAAKQSGGTPYTATPLSFAAFTALHRPLKAEELRRLETELGRPVADAGFYVVDILPAESAFNRQPRLR